MHGYYLLCARSTRLKETYADEKRINETARRHTSAADVNRNAVL